MMFWHPAVQGLYLSGGPRTTLIRGSLKMNEKRLFSAERLTRNQIRSSGVIVMILIMNCSVLKARCQRQNNLSAKKPRRDDADVLSSKQGIRFCCFNSLFTYLAITVV
uniref:Uncharacterized protein n=1 Tax=Opuntia streptacantha TaxID=393608 RepID=A0A7C9F0F0_OPUST